MNPPDLKFDPLAARRATEAVPGIPHDGHGPVFREPWEAQAFAMALALQQRGLFTWSEWAATLGAEIKRAQAAGDPIRRTSNGTARGSGAAGAENGVRRSDLERYARRWTARRPHAARRRSSRTGDFASRR